MNILPTQFFFFASHNLVWSDILVNTKFCNYKGILHYSFLYILLEIFYEAPVLSTGYGEKRTPCQKTKEIRGTNGIEPKELNLVFIR